MRFTQPPKDSDQVRPITLARSVRCDRVYDEYVLKGSFIGGLPNSIHQSLCFFWASSKQANVQQLARLGNFLSHLQNGLRFGEEIRFSDKRWIRCNDKQSQVATALYVNTNETTTAAFISSSETPNNASISAMPESRNLERPVTVNESQNGKHHDSPRQYEVFWSILSTITLQIHVPATNEAAQTASSVIDTSALQPFCKVA